MSKNCTLWEWQATTTPLSTPPKHCTVDVNRPRVIEIGDSASIAAGVTIGNNVIIGANTLINKDVPDNRVVVGNPQRPFVRGGHGPARHTRAELREARTA